MFTGIVEAVGTVVQIREGAEVRGLTVETDREFLAGVEPGDSVSVDGACLTPERVEERRFRLTAVASTLSRSIVSSYALGSLVNLERALRMGDRLDGHLVQGHVDGIGEVIQIRREGDTRYLDIVLPAEVHAMTIPRGSITVNGVSLTVNRLDDDARIEVAIIPHTWQHTNLSQLEAGAMVNVEGDLIGKYVGRLLHGASATEEDLTPEQLRRMGY